jgi:cold shock CspA family protein
MCKGLIDELKDGFGFIENIDNEREVLLNLRKFEGEERSLEMGVEVE